MVDTGKKLCYSIKPMCLAVKGIDVCGKVWFRVLDSALPSVMFNSRGKTNAIDDPDNLDPVITYRHVLSSNVGVQCVLWKCLSCNMTGYLQ